MSPRPSALGPAALCGALCLGSAGAAEPVGNPADLDFFESKIRPVLVERCLECHGPDSDPPDGNLRLDLKAGWEVGGDSGPPLTPGDAAGSLLMEALRYETYEMPPDGKLPAPVIADFERWIAAGAADPRGGTLAAPDDAPAAPAEADGWAYRTPIAEPVPLVGDEAWPRTPADRFVLAKIEAAGLTPAADAAPATAFRRLHFDLSGLPPEPADLAAYVADPSGANWEAAVDRLLASPRFGQTWGRHWLDVARYADSNGSDFNATWPDAWRYRDYVVEAFNADRPYDRFLVEQIAGDLLPAATDAQRTRQTVATGFLALGTKMLSERDKVKLTMDVADDQLDTVGRAAMGLTIGCARCHDHKFDPIPTRDYYALAGIFASTKTLDGGDAEVRLRLRPRPAARGSRGRGGSGGPRRRRCERRGRGEVGEGRGGGDRPGRERGGRGGRPRRRPRRRVATEYLHEAVSRSRLPIRRRLRQRHESGDLRRDAPRRRAVGGPAAVFSQRQSRLQRAGDVPIPRRRGGVRAEPARARDRPRRDGGGGRV